MTPRVWTMILAGATAILAVVVVAGAVRPEASAQMPMGPGRPMMQQPQMPHAQMPATVRALRAQLDRVDPSLLTPPQLAMYEYLKLLQTHLESMAGGMGMPGGMMPPGSMTAPQSSASGGPQAAAPHAVPTVTGARTVTLTAVEFQFRPATIRAKAGTNLNIVLVNRGAIEHDLEITPFDFHLHAQPRKQVSGGLRNLKAGTYEFVCTIPGHKEAGMRGRLVVTP